MTEELNIKKNSGFCEMKESELRAIDGGIAWVIIGVVAFVVVFVVAGGIVGYNEAKKK
jgi:lactobin A/cerein 7B family class IIb bacteriocin